MQVLLDLALAVLCCTTGSATLSVNKQTSTGSSEEARGLLETRELVSFSYSACNVEALDVNHLDCGGDLPAAACCDNDTGICNIIDNGGCPYSQNLGCCPVP